MATQSDLTVLSAWFSRIDDETFTALAPDTSRVTESAVVEDVTEAFYEKDLDEGAWVCWRADVDFFDETGALVSPLVLTSDGDVAEIWHRLRTTRPDRFRLTHDTRRYVIHSATADVTEPDADAFGKPRPSASRTEPEVPDATGDARTDQAATVAMPWHGPAGGAEPEEWLAGCNPRAIAPTDLAVVRRYALGADDGMAVAACRVLLAASTAPTDTATPAETAARMRGLAQAALAQVDPQRVASARMKPGRYSAVLELLGGDEFLAGVGAEGLGSDPRGEDEDDVPAGRGLVAAAAPADAPPASGDRALRWAEQHSGTEDPRELARLVEYARAGGRLAAEVHWLLLAEEGPARSPYADPERVAAWREMQRDTLDLVSDALLSAPGGWRSALEAADRAYRTHVALPILRDLVARGRLTPGQAAAGLAKGRRRDLHAVALELVEWAPDPDGLKVYRALFDVGRARSKFVDRYLTMEGLVNGRDRAEVAEDLFLRSHVAVGDAARRLVPGLYRQAHGDQFAGALALARDDARNGVLRQDGVDAAVAVAVADPTKRGVVRRLCDEIGLTPSITPGDWADWTDD